MIRCAAVILTLSLGASATAGAAALHGHAMTLPAVVGEHASTRVGAGESLHEIALREGVGFEAIADGNPRLDPWLPPPGTEVVLPRQVILPQGSGHGITVNLAEMRLFHIRGNAAAGYDIDVFPLGIGREGRDTPEGEYRVVTKMERPAWRVPTGLRIADPSLPAVVPPGERNPLGEYWLGLSARGYGIHGTNRPYGIGRRVSYGCLRLYPGDIAQLYAAVEPGTPVRIVYQPVKAAWHGDRLLLEAHRDRAGRFDDLFQEALRVIGRAAGAGEIDYARVLAIVRDADGLLHPVGERAP